jgi:hypothetical protein
MGYRRDDVKTEEADARYRQLAGKSLNLSITHARAMDIRQQLTASSLIMLGQFTGKLTRRVRRVTSLGF